MKKWFREFRRRAFPTREDQRIAGEKYASEHFHGCTTSAEADWLFEYMPIERGDPFDDAILEYYENLLLRFR